MIRNILGLAALVAILAGCAAGDVTPQDAASKDKEIKEATEKLNGTTEKPKEPGQQGD